MRFFRCVLVGGITTVILAATGPLLVAAGWHATHSSVQNYGGYHVRVPWPYVLLRRREQAVLVRAKAVPNLTLYQFSAITIRPEGGTINITAWKNHAIHALAEHGDPVSGSFSVPIGGDPGACVQRTINDSYFRFYATCRTENGTRIDYFGDADGLKLLPRILSGISVAAH